MKKNLTNAIPIILIVLSVIIFIVFEVCNFKYTDDETLNALLNGTIPRFAAGGALLTVLILLGCKKILKPELKSLPGNLLWCIPCFLVVLANFPFSALITGSAEIVRAELTALFIAECLAIGFMEETLFRGILQDTFNQIFKGKPHGQIYTVLLTSAAFGVVHLFNLFAGANVGATFLQVGYSFLIGAMLSAVLIKTDNLWLCVLLHAGFDFGGNIISELGTGNFQDLWFWIFTAAAGLLCSAHVLCFLIKQDKNST